MPYLKLQFRPGINREVTSHTNEGGWQDCDKIRFRSGFPETIGGWERLSNEQFLGVCRSLHTWVSLENDSYIAVGTNLKMYLVRGTSFFDITPIRATTTAGDVTFSATDGSNVLTVTDVGNGVFLRDSVIFSGAVSLGGNVTADVLNAEHEVSRVVNANTFEITLPVTASASDSGNGGASVVGQYQINTGLASAAFGSGWGADPWGAGGWGSPADTSIPGAQLRLWGVDNYGEDLLFCVRNGGVYYWTQNTGLGVRGAALTDLSGANKAPEIARVVMTSDRDRHAIAFGCDDEFAPGVQDPLLIRFSSQENITDWESRADNTAGSLRLSSGSGIVAAVKTRQQILVFTDVSLHAMQFIGPPFTFGINEISTATTIAGPDAAVAVNDMVFWMGEGDFYAYDGRVQKIPCTVREYVFGDFNIAQSQKVEAAHNSEHSEVWWFYSSNSGSGENDRYVVYNYADQLWYYGTMSRTAWVQRGIFGYSIAAAPDGYLYYHETGITDGSQNPPVGIPAFIESSPINLGEGDQFMFATNVIPDITFRSSTGTPSVDMTFKARNWPGDGYLPDEESNPVVRTSSVPIEKYTRKQDIRLRGRAISLKVSSDALNTSWRLGSPRLEVRPDGKR